jgi:hypothetical protein
VDPTDIGFIKGAIAFALIASTGLTAYWLRLRARFLAQRDPDALERAHEDLVRAKADWEARLLEIEERLDFAERRLLQQAPPVERIRTPRALTPV